MLGGDRRDGNKRFGSANVIEENACRFADGSSAFGRFTSVVLVRH